MKIVIINGSPRRGITYKSIGIVKEELQSLGGVTFQEFNLPQDMPSFCKGCFRCFEKGEEFCPDAGYVQPIVKALDEADGIIIGSPVYAMQISGALKALFDHLAYCYINHRPRFYRKKALVITTTVGAGISNCNKYIKQNLSFWGVNRIYTVGKPMLAIKWEEIDKNRREDFEKSLRCLAGRLFEDIKYQRIYRPNLMQTVMFNVSKAIIKRYEDDSADGIYWKDNGWLDGRKDFFVEDIKPGFLSKSVGSMIGIAFKRFILKNS